MPPTESDLLRHIYHRSADLRAHFPSVILGPGDDCAAVQPNPGPLLLTVDQLVEGRHFTPDTPIDLIARKAIARSLSDIAAMAGTPAWALAAGVIPDGYPHADQLFDALHRWALHWRTPLVGGDIASAPRHSPLLLSITVGGTPGPVGIKARSGAKPGDEVWVTGRFGGSLESGRHLTFEPRLAEAAWLSAALGDNLHALIDVSDGLGRDAARIAEASGVRIELVAESIPRHDDTNAAPQDPMRSLADGEDYELCFTIAPGSFTALTPPAALAPFTRIGSVLPGTGCIARDSRGHQHDISTLGWDHTP